MDYASGTETKAQTDLIINTYETNKAPLQKTILAAKTRFATLDAEYKLLDKGRKYRPVERMFENLLNKYNIIYQQHFSLTLIGEHCHRWLAYNEEILENCEKKCLLLG